MRDVDRYLAEVASGLPFTDEALVREVIQELEDHVTDSIEARTGEGTPANQAARETLQKLGPPDALARSIAKAHQTPRRLLEAVGGAVWVVVRSGVASLFAAWAIVMLVAVLLLAAVHRIDPDASSTWYAGGAGNTTLYAAMYGLSAFWVGTRVPLAMADRSRRSLSSAQTVCALTGVTILVPIVVLGVREPQSLSSIVSLLLVPVAFVLGCRRPLFARRGVPAVVVIAAVAAVFALVWGVATATPTTTTFEISESAWDPAAEAAPAGRTDLLADPGAVPHIELVNRGGGIEHQLEPGEEAVLRVAGVPAGFVDLQFELWRAAPGEPFLGTIDPAATAAFTAVSATPAASSPDRRTNITANLDLRGHRSLGAIVIVLIGVRDGDRYVVSHPLGEQWFFRGSIWEWFQAR
jgi:hypothetical protein